MNVYYATNTGKVRDVNEDNYLLLEDEKYILYAVADGMGGHNAGEVASEIAVNSIKELFDKNINGEISKIPIFINESINQANKKIREIADGNEKCKGMGTTLTMAIVDKIEKILYIGNIGDSRAYLVLDDSIKQITNDHSLVAEFVKQGKITEKEAENHPRRNIITRALGTSEDVFADIFEIEIEKNSKIMLCSDGLTSHLSDDEIFKTITNCDHFCAEELINIANKKGGTDNITVIIAGIGE